MREILFVGEETTRIKLNSEKWKSRCLGDVVRAYEKKKETNKEWKYFKDGRLLDPREMVGDGEEKTTIEVRAAEKRGPRVGLVCQLKDASERIESFVRYHVGIGFDKLYLYFDDCREIDDVDRALEAGGGRVSAAVRDRKLRDAWSRLDGWDTLQHFCDEDVQVRQMLNALHALERARNEDEIDWLLHLDSDELFYPGGDDDDSGSISEHFQKLDEDESCSIFTYYNYEAVPETDLDENEDPFVNVTLFKRPVVLVPRRAAGTTHQNNDDAIEFWRKRTPNNEFFLFYQNGKSAVRCSLLDAKPTSVHLWASSKETENPRLHQTNDPRNCGLLCDPSVKCAILHYACAGHLALWRKYATLGDFPNACVANTVNHEPNTFHCLCRDEFVKHRRLSTGRHDAAGTEDASSSRAAMRRLFLARVALSDTALISRHIEAGILDRVRLPSSILYSTSQRRNNRRGRPREAEEKEGEAQSRRSEKNSNTE